MIYNPVLLGSVSDLPAESCQDIKVIREDGQATNGNYWLDPLRSGKVVQVFCDMITGGEDFFLN